MGSGYTSRAGEPTSFAVQELQAFHDLLGMRRAPYTTIPSLICALTLAAAMPASAGGDEETPGPAGFEREGATVYAFDPGASTIRVLVYRGGFFSNAGHNHVLAVENFRGAVYLHDDLNMSGFELDFRLDEMVLDRPVDREAEGADFSSKLSEGDIANTRHNMLGEKGTQAEHYPEVRIRSLAVVGTPPEVTVTVLVTLHGVSQHLEVPVSFEAAEMQIVASGQFKLRQKDFGIKPFSAALGALKVKNELTVRFRLVARRQPDQPGRSE